MRGGPSADGPFQYALPPELIAQDPAPRRGDARLLLAARGGGVLGERRAEELPDLLRPGDLLVVNDSRVLPARLWASRPGGGKVELLLLRRGAAADAWLALARPARRLRQGQLLTLLPAGGVPERPEAAPVLAVLAVGDEGVVTVGCSDLAAIAAGWGEVPLPPYIRRRATDSAARRARDRERYQTVYAREEGSVAAPTAGLHLETSTLAALARRGVQVAAVTLHVGLGTFRPPDAAQIAAGRLHAEHFICPAATERAARAARAAGGRVIAVGTTTLRVLETVQELELPARGGPARRVWPPRASPPPAIAPVFTGEAARQDGGWRIEGETRLFLRPPAAVRAVDGLLTNFHLPGSSLLMLVEAFAGEATWRVAYAHAVAAAYRFYSYGDAMLLLPPERAGGGEGRARGA